MAVLWGGPFDGQTININPHSQVVRMPMVCQPTKGAFDKGEMIEPMLDIAMYSKTTADRYVYAGMEHIR